MTQNVFLFVPNLIGYSRIILAFISLYFLPTDPIVAMGFYGVSCLLDALDGYCARALNQSNDCFIDENRL
jgi:CDP-diacylglycerol--inositol 3-phosphatidyltransferase